MALKPDPYFGFDLQQRKTLAELFATLADADALQAQIDALEARVAELETP